MREVELWIAFLLGVLLYDMKRGDFMIKGKTNGNINNWREFFREAWLPIIYRMAIESCVFAACFDPAIVTQGLHWMGLEKAAFTVAILTQFVFASFSFGVMIDAIVDWKVDSIAAKIPIVKLLWCPFPGATTTI